MDHPATLRFSGAYAASFSLASIPNPCDPGRFEQTSQLFVDADENLYIADTNNHRIRKIGADGMVQTVAGSGQRPSVNLRCEAITGIGDNRPAREARLFTPAAVLLHPNGNLILTDQMNNRIRQVTPAGAISTLAGSGLHNLYAPPRDSGDRITHGLAHGARRRCQRPGALHRDAQQSRRQD